MIEERMRSPSCEVVLLSSSEAHTTKSNTCALDIQILIVDDDPTCLSIVAELLKRCVSPSEDEMVRLTITTKKSPLEALGALRSEHNFDIVVMSLHMEEVNGMEFQRQVVRELKVPFIVMSADANERLMLKTLEDGAIFYLLKPIKGEDIKKVWQYAVTTKREKSTIIEEGDDDSYLSIEQRGKSTIVEEGNDNSYLSIEKTPSHDTKPTSSDNDDINPNSGQETIISKVERKRGRKKKGKHDCDDDGELHSHDRKRTKVVWTSSLHSRFLLAVNHLGLDRAVPKRILQYMGVPGITRENIASHLQKYRLFLKKLTENGGTFPSNLSQRSVRSFASSSSFLYRRTKLEDLDMLSRRRLNPLFQSAYKSSNFLHLRHHNQQLPYVFRFKDLNNHRTNLLQSGGIRGTLTNSNQGLPNFGDNSAYYNIGTTSQVRGYGYNQISGNSPIGTQVNMKGSPYPAQNLNFNSYTGMQSNGMRHGVIGASNPSFNRSSGLLPNVGFNGANLGLTNWVSTGYMNVAPTLIRNEPLSYTSVTNPSPSPLSNNNDQPLAQQVNLLESSNGGTNNLVNVINMEANSSTNFANDPPSFGENMINHQLLDDIVKSGLQSRNSIAPSSDTNQLLQHPNLSNVVSHNTEQTTNLEVLLDPPSQQEDGVRRFTFSSDSSHYGAVEMNNLVSELPLPNFTDESLDYIEQTTDFEVLLDASSPVQGVHEQTNPINFDDIRNFESDFNPIKDNPHVDGGTKFTFSSDDSHYDAFEMNNLVAQLSHPNFSDEVSNQTEQTTNLEMLLDASSEVQGVHEQANQTNFIDEFNFESEFNPMNDKRQGDGVAQFTFSSDSFHYDSIEVNNLETELPHHNFANQLSHHIEQTTNFEVLLDDSNQAQGVRECVNPTNFDDQSNFDSEFNSVNDKRQEESERQTVELNLNSSFLAEIEAVLENKDWADQFMECLQDTEDWTSF